MFMGEAVPLSGLLCHPYLQAVGIFERFSVFCRSDPFESVEKDHGERDLGAAFQAGKISHSSYRSQERFRGHAPLGRYGPHGCDPFFGSSPGSLDGKGLVPDT